MHLNGIEANERSGAHVVRDVEHIVGFDLNLTGHHNHLATYGVTTNVDLVRVYENDLRGVPTTVTLHNLSPCVASKGHGAHDLVDEVEAGNLRPRLSDYRSEFDLDLLGSRADVLPDRQGSDCLLYTSDDADE